MWQTLLLPFLVKLASQALGSIPNIGLANNYAIGQYEKPTKVVMVEKVCHIIF